MPLVDRRLLVDRPTVTDPVIGGEDSENEQEEEGEIEVFGEGGGKTVHGIEFGKDQDEIIKASNLVAMLATGDDQPDEVFRDVFANAAIQLNHLQAANEDISGISDLSDEINASSIGNVVWEEEDEGSEQVVVSDESESGDGSEQEDESEDSEDSSDTVEEMFSDQDENEETTEE